MAPFLADVSEFSEVSGEKWFVSIIAKVVEKTISRTRMSDVRRMSMGVHGEFDMLNIVANIHSAEIRINLVVRYPCNAFMYFFS